MLVCPLMWKTDISSAYRRCPLRPQHQQYHAAVFACDGVTYISQQRSLSFGAIASVWGFHRVGNFLLALARQRWMIIAMRYVDDFFGLGRPGVAVGPGRMCSIIFGAFGWMCDMEKTTDFQEALVVLGAKCFISWSRRSVSLSVAHDKLTRWLKTIDVALASGVLVPSLRGYEIGWKIKLDGHTGGQPVWQGISQSSSCADPSAYPRLQGEPLA